MRIAIEENQIALDLRRMLDAEQSRPGAAYEAVKRIVDVLAAAALLLLAAPLMVFIATAVGLSSRGPCIFRQVRLGRGGRTFSCYKFRTMSLDAEDRLRADPELAAAFRDGFKLKDDPRVTRLGRFLRKSSLDDLPQLVNVLRGDISLIGPRPIVSPELAKYGRHGELLLSVRPGLSGYWQVYGRSDTSYAQRVEMDMKYIAGRGFWLDLKLAALTVVVVLRGRGAY